MTTLRRRIEEGKLSAYREVAWPKYPWVGHAYRRIRLYIRGEELERYMREREAEEKERRESKKQHSGKTEAPRAGARGNSLRKEEESLRAREGESKPPESPVSE